MWVEQRRALAAALETHASQVRESLGWAAGNPDEHLEFLAAAVRVGRPDAYAGYLAWCGLVLEARGVPRETLRERVALLHAQIGRAELEPYLERGLHACLHGLPEAPPSEPLDDAARRYLQALLAGDRQEALAIAMRHLDAHAGSPLPVLRAVELAQRELGVLWERGEITETEEHLGTFVTQFVLARVGARLELPAPTRGRAIVAGVEGDLHQVGGQMVSDALALDGWDVRFLGANNPAAAVLDVLEKDRPRLLVATLAMLSRLPRAEELVALVRRRMGVQAPRILVGGGGLRQIPDLWREIGADGGGADLQSAVAAARGAGPPHTVWPHPILVVDDEPVVRRLAARILQRQGFTTLEAGNHEEALARAEGTLLEAAVLDVVMPGVSGPELARRLRAERPHLPLLFISGHAEPEDLPAGAVFVAKPFTMGGLTEALHRAMAQAC